jgi:hypothetical protein
MILIYQKGAPKKIKNCEIKNFTNIPYVPSLEFVDFRTLCRIRNKTKGILLDREHSWLSAYFKKELLHMYGACSQPLLNPPKAQILPPSLSLRWIDDKVGWGVFAERDIQALEFIAEYSGLVRKRTKHDCKNAYCFEYPIKLGEPSAYVIDAQDMGGISRYINHSEEPNLTSLSVHLDGFNHIILYSIKPIPKNAQLCYDYGPGYWKARPKPRVFSIIAEF